MVSTTHYLSEGERSLNDRNFYGDYLGFGQTQGHFGPKHIYCKIL